MLDWNDLRFVLETARRGGISGAARAIGVSHATVARRIGAAEEVLGARLFDRLASGYVVTEAGRDAVAAAEAMEAAGAALGRRVAGRDARIEGPLTVTAPQLLIERVLAPVIGDFVAAHPGVDLTLLATNEVLNLAARDADVALRISNDPAPSLVGQRVCDQRAGVYASAEFVARDRGGALDWIRFTSWPGPPAEVRAARPDLRTRLSVDDMYAAIAAARLGLGATRMAHFLGATDPALVRVPGIPDFAYAPVWVLTHADLAKVPRVRAFTGFAAQRLRALRGLFLSGAAG